MKHLTHARGLLRPIIFSSFALAALASSSLRVANNSDVSWLTHDALSARDGSPLRLFEDHYTDVGFVVERNSLRERSALAQSDYDNVEVERTGSR